MKPSTQKLVAAFAARRNGFSQSEAWRKFLACCQREARAEHGTKKIVTWI
jgi:hypothetical protein